MFMLHKPNSQGEQIVNQVQEEIARIQKEGMPANELERVRTFFRSCRINQLENVMNRATILGQYELLDGDASWINREMDQFLAVTPEQIQAAAKKYLQPQARIARDRARSQERRRPNSVTDTHHQLCA